MPPRNPAPGSRLESGSWTTYCSSSGIGSKSIHPRRFRPVEKRNQLVSRQRRFATEAHYVRQPATSSLAEQFLIGTPRQSGQREQKFHQAKIEERMADFDRDFR